MNPAYPTPALRVLGIDPGTHLTGYGCVELAGRQLHHISHGTIRLSVPGTESPLEERLLGLYLELTDVIRKLKPHVLAVEKIFFAENAVSALKLGHARGVVLLCSAQAGIPVFEHAATEVKLALTGFGRSDKAQVARMVSLLTGARDFATADASDALALAVCHVYLSAGNRNATQRSISTTAKKKRLSLADQLVHRSRKGEKNA